MDIENTSEVNTSYIPPEASEVVAEANSVPPAAEPIIPPAPLPEDQGQNIDLFA